MNADYKFYFAQLDAQAGKGQPPETTPGTPHAGFYRLRRRIMIDNPNPAPGESRKNPKVIYEPVAIWKDGDEWACAKPGFCPTKQDEIDDLFSRVCRDAVPEDVYRAAVAGAPWPDEVAERAPAEPARIGPTETQEAMYGQGRSISQENMGVERDYEDEDARASSKIGDNSGAVDPSAIMADRIRDVLDQFADWLKTLPDQKIATQEQADRAANFASLLADLEKEADTTHTAEKAPWLAGGREVDGRWKPLIERAAEAKKRIKKNYVAPYLAALKAKAEAEAKAERDRLAAEHAKQVEEAAQIGVEAPPPPPVVEPAKIGAGTRGGRATGLRVVKKIEIEDVTKVAAYLAGMNPPPADFLDACKKVAEKILKAGSPVPGAKLVDHNTAS